MAQFRVHRIELAIILSPCLEGRRRELAGAVADAQRIIASFAAAHGWSAYLRPFFPNGMEVFDSQHALWERILSLHGIPKDIPLPTRRLAAAIEQGILLTLTPEEYARVAPDYGTAPGAFIRLLAHEMAHRLHVALLEGDEEGMGPPWFYEGFAVVASGDLADPRTSSLEQWDMLISAGEGAYRRYGALLRRLMERSPLPELIQRARESRFDQWARQLFESGDPDHP